MEHISTVSTAVAQQLKSGTYRHYSKQPKAVSMHLNKSDDIWRALEQRISILRDPEPIIVNPWKRFLLEDAFS